MLVHKISKIIRQSRNCICDVVNFAYHKYNSEENMDKILMVFVVVFFALSAISLGISIYYGDDITLSKNCKSTSRMAFIISIILLYLWFVFK